MGHVYSLSNLTRRGFLQLAGVATGAVIMPELPRDRTLTVGVLLPSGALDPAISAQLVAGLRQYVASAGLPVTLRTVESGLGASAALRQSRLLVERAGADVVVGMLSEHVAVRLHAFYAEQGVPLIVCNAGANVVRPEDQAPYLFYTSLKLWQSNWALGQWASQHLGERVFCAMSFYDSGYDAPYMFRQGVEAGGGTVIETQISHMPTEPDSLDSLMDAIRAAQPDAVYASYCGAQAVTFVKAYAQAGLAGQIPLIGSAFLVDQHVLSELGSVALGIKSSLGESGADAFTTLGYDAARLIDRMTSEPPRRDAAADAKPLFLREVRRIGLAFDNVASAQLASVAEYDIQRAVAVSSPKSGWLMPYLCR